MPHMEHGMIVDGHLGGFVPGGDPATQYPDLWRWLIEEQGVKSVIDVGCGDGQAVGFFRDNGCVVVGVDGIPQDDPDIIEHDFRQSFLTAAPPEGWPGRFDLAWSCEFVEHVEEPFMPNFLGAFRLARVVLMTHAEPGQAGWHHVNCQPADYWKGALAAVGYRYDDTLTEQTRRLAALNTNPYNHYLRSGLAFRRETR